MSHKILRYYLLVKNYLIPELVRMWLDLIPGDLRRIRPCRLPSSDERRARPLRTEERDHIARSTLTGDRARRGDHRDLVLAAGLHLGEHKLLHVLVEDLSALVVHQKAIARQSLPVVTRLRRVIPPLQSSRLIAHFTHIECRRLGSARWRVVDNLRGSLELPDFGRVD